MTQFPLLADRPAPLREVQDAGARRPVFATRRRGLQHRSLTCCSTFFCAFSGYGTMLPTIRSSALRFKCGFRDGTSRLEAAMREPGSEGKLRVYRTMYRLNVSFANIVAHCRALRESGMLTRKYAHLYQSYAQELQAEINQDVVETLDGIDQTTCFGSARCARHAKRNSAIRMMCSSLRRSGARNLQSGANRTGPRENKKMPALKRGVPQNLIEGEPYETTSFWYFLLVPV